MKNLLIILFINAVLIFGMSISANAQCDSDEFLDNCAELLGDFTFMKSFNVNTDKSAPKAKFKAVLSKDHTYIITVCGGNSSKKMIINLYDRNQKLISSSYYKPKNLFVKKIGFKCTATGVYYIEAYFEDDASGCGVTILGFKKN